jgi:glycosyltransferase involved in cell wall biosynthesis
VARAVSGSAGKGLTGVYAYEDGALDTFRAARARGLRTLYDLPIGYHRAAQRLFAEEAELSPDFAPMLDGLRDSGAKLERKAEEARLADRIIVPSEFVRQTLEQEGFPASRIRLVPFGAPDAVRARTWTDEDLRRPLRLLFAGSVGQRKGIGYLLQAMRLLKGAPVELAVLGTVVGDSAPLAPYRDLFRHEPTRPHAEVLELMRSCDVLVLPSLWEGLAQVQLEALACGLPLLVTPNAGGAHLVRDGINGFLVPIRSPEALAEKIRWFVANREALPAMSAAAAAAARQSTWSAYREGIVRAATEPLGETFR